MTFREIFRFELAYQIRRVSTWLYFGSLVVFAFLLVRGIGEPPSVDHFINAPSVIASVTVFGGVIWLLIAASIAGDAGARDVQTRMHPLLYTTPISRSDYLGGRFLAAFVLNALILLAVPAGILIATYLPGLDAELVGPFRPAAYLTAYAFIALPNAFIATAIQFRASALSGRPIASYLASVLFLAVAQLGLSTVAQLLGRWQLVKLFDAVGLIGIVSSVIETWTPIEQNTRLLQLEGWLLANRILWLGVAAGFLAWTYARFQLAHPAASTASRASRRRAAHSAIAARPAIAVSTRITIPHVRRTFGFATHARQALAIASDSFRTIARSRAGLILVTALGLAMGVLANRQFLGVPLIPRTEQVIRGLTTPLGNVRTPWVILPLLIVFYAGELVWRERDASISEIADAAPVPDWVLFGGKLLGLCLVIVVWRAIAMASGMLGQLQYGYTHFEVGLYLKTVFALQLPDYFLFALLALVVHVLVDQLYVGHLVGLITFGFIVLASRLGIQHNLLVYASDPGWSYTDMSGFGPTLGPWLWFKLYWAAWALLLAVAARLLWVRGMESRLAARLQLSRYRFTRHTAWSAAAALALIVTFGGFTFYNTNVRNEYRTASDTMERRAEYERRYGQYEDIVQPQLAGTSLHVDIYPRRRALEIRGTHRLLNRSAVAIDSIHVASAPDVKSEDVTFDRPASRVLDDDELGYRIYALKEPLLPGDSLQLSFEVKSVPHGFTNSGVDVAVVANGTYFRNRDFLPDIGYQRNRSLTDAAARRAHGLAPRKAIPSLYDAEEHHEMAGGERIDFAAVVSTDADQVAVAPGTLRRTWTEGARRYFDYASDAPMNNQYAFFSANYAVREARWNDVAIQIFHHPGHAENVERMIRSVQASLSYFTEQFAPYPYRSIKIVEHPGHGMGMHADAGMINYEEGFSLINPDSLPALDLPFYVVSHEVAHQWWGMQLAPAIVEGAPLLDETLATYSGLRIVEKTLGREQMRRLLNVWRDSYEIPRTRAAAPLLRATVPFLYRRKGPLAMHALREYVSEERMNEALRRLLEKHGSGTPPLPTSLDLYRELQAATPDSLHSLLRDLFETNAYWQLETQGATSEETKAGTWQVTLTVNARKVVVDSAGVENAVPMNDVVQIGVFAPTANGKGSEPVYLQMHRIRSGDQTITVTVPRKPTRAGIDPNHLLIELKTSDNNKTVKVKEGTS